MAGAIPQDVNGDTATTTLFTQVFFHIIESERLTITEAEKVCLAFDFLSFLD